MKRRSRPMWFGFLFAVIVMVVVGAVWLSAGSWLTLLVDQVFAVGVPMPPVDKLAYDGGGFRIGGLSLTFGALDNQRSDIELHSDASSDVLLTSGGHSFVLGPRTSPVDQSGRPDMAFVPSRGDQVALTATRSLLGWATPFAINFMTQMPSWKRYVYYRLVWKKQSGAELAMRWRYEQDYFSGRGWTEPLMMWNFQTGLLRVDITDVPRVTSH